MKFFSKPYTSIPKRVPAQNLRRQSPLAPHNVWDLDFELLDLFSVCMACITITHFVFIIWYVLAQCREEIYNIYGNVNTRNICVYIVVSCRVPARWSLQQTTLGSGQRQDTGSGILWSTHRWTSLAITT